MPTTLTESSTFTTDVTVPNDGDTRNAASVRSAFQALANRTKFLKDIIGAGGSGATRLRTVTTAAALRALTGMVDGDLALLKPGDPSSQAIYIYSSGSSDAEIGNWVYEPDAGGGRWLNLLWPRGTGTTSDTLRWAMPVPNRIVADAWTESAASGNFSITATGGNDESGFESDAIDIEEDDIVTVDMACSIESDDAANQIAALIAYEIDGGGDVVLDRSRQTAKIAGGATDQTPFRIQGRLVAPSSGSYVFKLIVVSGNSAAVVVHKPTTARVMVVRP